MFLLSFVSAFAGDIVPTETLSLDFAGVELELSLPSSDRPEAIALVLRDDGGVELAGGARLDPYKNFKFRVVWDASPAAIGELTDLCLTRGCPSLEVWQDGEGWVYAPEDDSSSAATSDNEWRYVPVRRF